jgi:hypothetical protein
VKLANIKTTPEEIARAKFLKYAKKKKRKKALPKGKSVRAISGGLPGLGKR